MNDPNRIFGRDTLYPHPHFKVNFLNSIKKNKYKIALIPLAIDINKFKKIDKEGFTLYLFDQSFSASLKEAIISASELAAKERAKLIIFSELSYPYLEKDDLDKELNKICSRYGCYIIAGSYHELEGKDAGSNKSLIFIPHSKVLSQIKTTCGFLDGKIERIRIPNHDISIFQTEFGNFVIAIGVAIMDANLIKRL